MTSNNSNEKTINLELKQEQKHERPAPLSKALRLPIDEEDYESVIGDSVLFRIKLDEYYHQYPELFPESMSKGYHLHGFTRCSTKMNLSFRRILIDPKGERCCYNIYPSFVMPFMRGKTEELEKMLFLNRFGVPFWALGYVFNKDAMYCYRAVTSISGFSLVGTTIKQAEKLPDDLVADEKHSKIKGKKAYIATTAANECILGVGISETPGEAGLESAYAIFKSEATDVNEDYQPGTVNTDGWLATKKAWKNLFSCIQVIECFLHAILNIHNAATNKTQALFSEIVDKAWRVYQAENLISFSQRLRRLKEWATKLDDSNVKDKLLKLCSKKQFFTYAYRQKTAHRTSNMVDRLMDGMDRFIYSARYFHKTPNSAEKLMRSYALIYNFSPSCPQTIKKHEGKMSPAERLNGFRYSDKWLHNLLIAGSRNGYRCLPHKAL